MGQQGTKGGVCWVTWVGWGNPSQQVAKRVNSPLLDSEMGVVFVGF